MAGILCIVYSQLRQRAVKGLIFGGQASLEAEEVDSHAAGYTSHLLQGFNSLFQKAVLSTEPLQARLESACALLHEQELLSSEKPAYQNVMLKS